MKTKVITLCDKTWALAKEKKNFSEWVRAQLLASDEVEIDKGNKAFKIFQETGKWPEWY